MEFAPAEPFEPPLVFTVSSIPRIWWPGMVHQPLVFFVITSDVNVLLSPGSTFPVSLPSASLRSWTWSPSFFNVTLRRSPAGTSMEFGLKDMPLAVTVTDVVCPVAATVEPPELSDEPLPVPVMARVAHAMSAIADIVAATWASGERECGGFGGIARADLRVESVVTVLSVLTPAASAGEVDEADDDVDSSAFFRRAVACARIALTWFLADTAASGTNIAKPIPAANEPTM